MIAPSVGVVGRRSDGRDRKEHEVARLTEMESLLTTNCQRESLAAIASEAASRVMKLATDPGSRQAFLSAAVRTTLAKGDEVHFYKFLAAILEDTALVGAQWQPRFLAASVHYMKGPSNAEPIAIKRAREAMRALPA